MAERTDGQEISDDETEGFLQALAQIFAHRGAAREVAVLAEAEALFQQDRYDNYGPGTYYYSLSLKIPHELYAQLLDLREELENSICERAREIFHIGSRDELSVVHITPQVSNVDPEWRTKAKAWLSGTGITNQGRVRSANVASKSCDGLLFRSQPEIFLYQALKASGVSFAPLPVFIRGGQHYKRIEPDFIIIKDGITLHVEVDGDTVHQETPAEAHERTEMLHSEGVIVERIKASDCDSLEKAAVVTTKLLATIQKRRTNAR